jgi:pSer/pThr/pTyr-binding forkhead associated (FHA) protein
MQVVLVMFRPEGDRRSFSITRELTVIGRREDCDFRIPLGEISRKHCRLIRDGEQLRIEDLGSSNGTYHNGARVQEATLSPGDTLQVGSVVFVVQIDGVPADDELQPVASAGGTSREGHSVETAPMGDEMTTTTGNGEAEVEAEGEFDPMSVLESGDSAVAQESMVIDLEESSHGEAV